MTARFAFTPATDAGNVALIEKRLLGTRPLPLADWHLAPAPLAPAVRYIQRLVASGAAISDGANVRIPTEVLVDLPASIAAALGLPPFPPLSLTIALRGRIETTDGRIDALWNDPNMRRVSVRRDGLFLTYGQNLGRLSPPVHDLLIAVDAYNASADRSVDERLPFWLGVQERLALLSGREVRADTILQNLRIYQAGAFALDVREAVGGPRFDPILMATSKRQSLADETTAPEGDGGDGLDDDLRDNLDDALLTPNLQAGFTKAFNADGLGCRPSYVIGRNTYLVVEPELRQALDIVKRLDRASESERRAFLRNPRSFIAEALPDAGEEIGTLFVETRQYSERVKGLGIWQKPKLPWLSKKRNGWLPERFVLSIGERQVELNEEGLTDLSDLADAAHTAGRDRVVFGGQDLPTDDVRTAIDRLREMDEPPVEYDHYQDSAAPADRNVLLMVDADNIEAAGFVATLSARPLFVQRVWPSDDVKTPPKPHQTSGFGWLVDAWTSGSPGALLADDMGLGKTLQSLAFLAWFRANRRAARAEGKRYAGPVLVVAPTALLRNWQKEAESHLKAGALGECVEAFGPGLTRLKTDRPPSPEDALDVARLRDAGWILTTYETLANYHRAFARVAYAVAIFDEMQKIKAPDTINTHAAKVMNADFVLGMTGTPIENRIEDIWCLMDRVVPGHFGGLKAFSASYGKEDDGALRELKTRLDQPTGPRPALMLRRMKHDHLKGLPERAVRPYRAPMPPEQAEAYSSLVASALGGGRSKGDMLKTIHGLRGVSLHPHGAGGLDPYDAASRAAWIESSARVKQTLAILTAIRGSGEKALVFIEDRAVQAAFAAVAASELELSAEPEIINGEVAGDRRQQVVERFQSAPPGFALLVLSPKAAGIGLTITAANHVIHLSRWWNPAVEDQCNDRVYRIGQERPVTVHVPMAVHPAYGEASFDLKLDAMLERKRVLSRDMLAPPVSDSDAETLFGEAVGRTSSPPA